MVNTLVYIIIYYNIDTVLKHLYIPYVVPNIIINDTTLSSHTELYFLLKMTSFFMIASSSFIIGKYILIQKIVDKNCLGMLFVYLKYILEIIFIPNMKMIEYETSRCLMWCFSTNIMLKTYIEINGINDNFMYYFLQFISIFPHILIIPYKNTCVYYISITILFIPTFLFLKKLYKHKQLSFTKLYILVWITFLLIHILELTHLVEPCITHALFNIADTVCKYIFNNIIANYNEETLFHKENIDLQSINFLSKIIECINQFEIDNTKLTPFCNELLNYNKQNFIKMIPKPNNKQKIELLTKLLPFGLDKEYILNKAGIDNDITSNKKFDFVCVLFMDIVNYTELAKQYDSDTIFNLLNKIYRRFDNIIKKYSYLQKIETIGDAYMVVGDIFRDDDLNYKIVIKEIILLAIEFLKNIKLIETPNNTPLHIRIGIHIGSVNIGILGNEIPRLCIVGNTVNKASRLQSTADENSIQISRQIYEYANEIIFDVEIEYIEKKNVFLKNIGSVTTYTIGGT